MPLTDTLQFFAATDVGRKRSHNEDNYLVDAELGLFVVADGMGGHACGEVASAVAVRTIHEVLRANSDMIQQRIDEGPRSEVSKRQLLGLLEKAVHEASARIHAEAQRDSAKRGMGTTTSILLIAGSHAYIAHVGDSRIYLARGRQIHQITEDHTVANELIRLGMVKAENLHKVPKRNAITRAVGVYERVEVDTLTLEVVPSDQFLLASDGLTGYFDDTEADVNQHLAPDDGDGVVQELVRFANGCGGKDNITCLLVRLGRGDVADSERAKRVHLKREVLAALPLFTRLNERELLRVMQVAEVFDYSPGEVVIREGEIGDQMFVPISGRLQVAKGQAVLGEFGPGDQFGEMALIRSSPRSATVKALDPSELISLRRGDFFEIIRTEPHVSVKLLWQFLNVLAERLERTSRDLSTARDLLEAEDVGDFAVSDQDPFTQPYGAALRYRSAPEAPQPHIVDHMIEDSPSFDDAPAMAQRLDDSFDRTPPDMAAQIQAIRDDPDYAAEFARRIDSDPTGVPFDKRETRRTSPPPAPAAQEPRAQEPGAQDPSPSAPIPLASPAPAPIPPAPAPPVGSPPAPLAGSVPFDKKKTLVGRRKPVSTMRSVDSSPELDAVRKAAVESRRERAKTTRRDAAEVLPPEGEAGADFVPAKATVPLDEGQSDGMREELDALRSEFKERLRKSREERQRDKSD
jgi:serine/threonine protein phosphatase PrpC